MTEENEITPEINGHLFVCSIKPKLPDGLNFEESTGRIYGEPTEIKDEVYKVKCSNSQGSSDVSFKLTVINTSEEKYCENNGMVYLKTSIITNKNSQNIGFEISNSEGEIFNSKSLKLEDNSQYYYKKCINEGVIDVVYNDLNGNGWGESKITLSVFGIVISDTSLYAKEYRKTLSYNCIFLHIISKLFL